jgi:hypothetical protein
MLPNDQDMRPPPKAKMERERRARVSVAQRAETGSGGSSSSTCWAANLSYRQTHFGNLGGFRDGLTKQNTPNAPKTRIGIQYRQLTWNVVSAAVQVTVSDEPLPMIRECEKAMPAISIANADTLTSETPIFCCVVILIIAMPPNDQDMRPPPKAKMERERCARVSVSQ